MSFNRVAPQAPALVNHWDWRPEWAANRPCLYWYLTFDAGQISRAVGGEVLEAVDRVPWLDPVPPRWMHLTLCDVGFVDDLDRALVHGAAQQVRDAVVGQGPIELELGPVSAFPGAVVLTAGPLETLRALQDRVRSATERLLGPEHELVHRHEFWPHVSLGYVNRSVPAEHADRRLDGLADVSTVVQVDRLALVAVTRRHRHYQWTLHDEVPLEH